MSGTINLSLSQQFDAEGNPLAGGLLYFFAAGTTTPQNAFQDTGLSVPYPNPMTLDASGRIPQFFLADGQIKIRLTDKYGVTVIAYDNLLVIGPSSGGGGGTSVDATTVAQTGDVKARYGTGTVTGWVRLNGRTIGSATSGASEFAHATAQALFEFLWNNDSTLAVVGGRGASSISDWTANKQITLPDARGRVLAALDDMGNTSAGRLSQLSSTTLGASGGGQSFSVAPENMPPHNHAVALTTGVESVGHAHDLSSATIGSAGSHSHTATVNDPTHLHALGVTGGLLVGGASIASGGNFGFTTAINQTQAAATGVTVNLSTDGAHGHSISGNSGNNNASHTHAVSGNTTSTGSGTPVNSLPPMLLITNYIKL